MKSATTSLGCGASGKRGSLATVRRFNATLSAKGYVWFWPKITAALTLKRHWLVIACDSCDSVVDLDLRVKPRDPEGSIRVASVTYNALDATAMADRVSLRWRDTCVDLKFSTLAPDEASRWNFIGSNRPGSSPVSALDFAESFLRQRLRFGAAAVTLIATAAK